MELQTKFFDDENELKMYLDRFKMRFGKTNTDSVYIISFYDNKSDALIYNGIYNNPIGSLRDLNTIIPERKIPIQDIDVCIECCFSKSSDISVRFGYSDNPMPVLDYHLYFKDKKEVVEQPEREIKN